MDTARGLILLGTIVLSLLAAGLASAEVKLASPFGDHMVLQRDRPAPVWGQAAPGERVTVTLGAQQAAATAGRDGRWKVSLPALPAGGPHTLTVAGKKTVTVSDVLVGEVWLASGQSNMHFALERTTNGAQEVAGADVPTLRFFQVAQAMTVEPQSTCQGRWAVCSPATAGAFSGVAYFFARDLQRRLGVPVGILQATWSGSPIQPLMDPAALAGNPAFRPLREHLARAKKDASLLEAEDWPSVPSSVYNAMVHPLIPYALRGAIWYQGEGNVGEAYRYRTFFPALIQGWRRAWGQGDFPFLFVQLVNVGPPPSPEGPGESERAELREAQATALSLPNTGMAVAIDLGEGRDPHPPNKRDVGRRLALLAGHAVYGWEDEYSGPVYRSMQIKGNAVRLRFDHAADGMFAKGGKLTGFGVAGADRHFLWADAALEGDAVVVSSPKVPVPVAVRYAWGENPPCTLYNAAGLPAAPFRTDDWPGETWPK